MIFSLIVLSSIVNAISYYPRVAPFLHEPISMVGLLCHILFFLMEMVLHPTKQNIHTTKQRTQRVLTQVTTQNVENLLPNDNTPRKESKDERGFHRLRLVDMSFVIKSNQVVNPPLLIPLLG